MVKYFRKTTVEDCLDDDPPAKRSRVESAIHDDIVFEPQQPKERKAREPVKSKTRRTAPIARSRVSKSQPIRRVLLELPERPWYTFTAEDLSAEISAVMAKVFDCSKTSHVQPGLRTSGHAPTHAEEILQQIRRLAKFPGRNRYMHQYIHLMKIASYMGKKPGRFHGDLDFDGKDLSAADSLLVWVAGKVHSKWEFWEFGQECQKLEQLRSNLPKACHRKFFPLTLRRMKQLVGPYA